MIDSVAPETKDIGGRPRKSFDWNLVESLAIAESTVDFVAERLVIKEKKVISKNSIAAKVKLIERRIREKFDCTYVEYRSKKIENKRIQLRDWQWRAARGGNITMLIWLGKQYLGQSDKLDQSVEHSGEISAGKISQEKMDKILSDPESTKLAQELAIRLAGANSEGDGINGKDL